MHKHINKVLLLQLPIPRLNFRARTGNIPLAAACLKRAVSHLHSTQVDLMPERVASFLGDAALLRYITQQHPDLMGFTIYAWNVERAYALVKKLRERIPVKTVFGGPEITPDHELVQSVEVDFFAFGEGEAVWQRLLTEPGYWPRHTASESAGNIFTSSLSPYLDGLLDPHLENLVLLETQRGCPHRCGYCYYNKAKARVTSAPQESLLTAVKWAIEAGVNELCLLDPCLNSRPHIKKFLAQLAKINYEKKITFNSEIRAEAIDEEMADLFSAAGFSYFEIGLQSIQPQALKLMNRPTNLKQFLHGTRLLKERKISPRLDLILGLPGDTLAGFKQSVDFVVEHCLADDIQVFPLLVLPGTDFRFKSKEFGLSFNPNPPYPVIKTSTFSEEDLLRAIDYAEAGLEAALYPPFDLEVSFRSSNSFGLEDVVDQWVSIEGEKYLAKIIFKARRSSDDLERLAERLTHPYQIFVCPAFNDDSNLTTMLHIFTSGNPFTPFELIFLEPQKMPNLPMLLSACQLHRPHYLDLDLRYQYPKPGNRAILFTLISERSTVDFCGEMKRQIFWWKKPHLPEQPDFEALSDWDGILIDSMADESAMAVWQERYAAQAEDLPWLSFASLTQQERWLKLSTADRYYLGLPFSSS